MNKKIITILLILLLIYLLFAKIQTVEGIGPAEEFNFADIFSNLFTFGETGKGCLKDDDSYIFNVQSQDFDIREPLQKMFDNLSNDNCVITIDKLIEYGFPGRFLEQIFQNRTEITVDDMNEKINEIKSGLNPYGGILEGMGNIGPDSPPLGPGQVPFLNEGIGPENRETINHYDRMLGGLCFLYCCFALGRESIQREQLTYNLSEWASTNYMVKMVYTIIPNKSVGGLFDVFSDKNDTIPNFNAFLNTKIRKSNVKEFLDNDIDTIINIINMLEENGMIKIPDGKDIQKRLNDSVDKLYDKFGKNNIIVMKDTIQTISEKHSRKENMLRKTREKNMNQRRRGGDRGKIC